MSTVVAAVAPAAAQQQAAAAASLPAGTQQQVDDEVVILDSDNEGQNAQRATSGRSAGPSSRPAAAAAAQQQRRRPRPPQAGGSGAAGASGGAGDIIDLTSDSPPSQDDIQIVRSTVVPRQPTRGAKRPRTLPTPAAAAPAGLPPALAGLSPTKQRLLAQLYNPPPPPQQPEAEPEGPKCGICMEPMGGSQGRPMASGPCGHVYCHECLLEAVRAQKKCPTCRKTLQVRQIHKVFVNFS